MRVTDGQIEKPIIDRSRVFNLLDCESSLPSGLFTLERANMFNEKPAKVVPKVERDRWVASHCIKCVDYTHRGGIAQGMTDLDYLAGARWDFDTCRATCWKERRTKAHDWQNAYYWRTKGGLTKNERGK